MKNIKVFENFIKESGVDYLPWEKGLILAWGNLLYLGYHSLPENSKKVSDSLFKSTMEDYWRLDKDSEEFEDMSDWFSDTPPRLNDGTPLFDKGRLRDSFEVIAQKYPAKTPLTLYRTSREAETGINSYTTEKGQYSNLGYKEREYLLPIGTKVIWADGIADDNEVIWNPSQEDLDKYLIN